MTKLNNKKEVQIKGVDLGGVDFGEALDDVENSVDYFLLVEVIITV